MNRKGHWRGRMRIYRQLGTVVSLLVGAALAVPAAAQQQPEDTTPAASAPAKPAKPKPKPKPVAPAPVAATPAPTAAPAAATPKPPTTPGGPKPTLLGQYGDWGAYSASPGGKKICFAIAKPASGETTPPNRPRNPAYMFITSRPADKVADEVSIIIGYPFKPGSEASVDVGSTSFALYTQQDGAWIKNATEESHLVDAMRDGQTAVVKGVSAKGTQSTDTFSLKGLSQALERTGQDCK
jgi:invasion protein IalB